MNIITDFLARGKRVLYVNHDIDNIWDVERNFKMIGLSGFVFNLVNFYEQTALPETQVIDNIPEYLDYSLIDKVTQYEATWKKKSTVFRISFCLNSWRLSKHDTAEPIVSKVPGTFRNRKDIRNSDEMEACKKSTRT